MTVIDFIFNKRGRVHYVQGNILGDKKPPAGHPIDFLTGHKQMPCLLTSQEFIAAIIFLKLINQ